MDLQAIVKALPEMVAQLLGFLIVFFILKKYAFGPVLGIIDARRKAVEDAFADIDQKKKNAEDLEKDYRRRIDRIEEEARVKIQEAANVGLALARDIQDRARLEAQKLVDRARADIEQDIQKARLQMRDDIVELSGLMTEKVLREKLDPQAHRKLVDQFIQEMEKVS